MTDKYINPISSKTEDLSSKGETTNQPSNNSSTRADQNYKNNIRIIIIINFVMIIIFLFLYLQMTIK